ncbi:MAG: DUF1186 domain-containing protein [Chloroflexota bacterium]
MSKRRRHAQKQSDFSQIEWLKHRTGYPTPEEREKIIHMRQQLIMELATLMVRGVKPQDAEGQRLVRKYGTEEVERAVNIIGEVINLPVLIAEDAKNYREYRQRYARFGAGLKFYSAREIEEMQMAHTQSIKEIDDISKPSELDKLLLYGWRDWEDITPPAIPIRPDDFHAPQPASYPAPVNELLAWGDDLKRVYVFVDDMDVTTWKKHIPALTRMALDPGLLNGWPAEPASWAPWHAIHILGKLQAWESAPALAKLADLENDWLSDHLPHIWADMGAEVEPSLWAILEAPSASVKQRGLAAQSLSILAEDDEAIKNKVIKGFAKMLGNAKIFNPTVNAYLIHFLRDMHAVENVRDVIESAFEEERVDLNIIAPEDLEEDYEDDFYDESDDEADE